MNFRTVCYGILSFISCSAAAQDTLNINIRQADSLFLTNNASLLASSMNIEAQKAQIIQAKAYPNPVFTADINVYDPENQKALHIGQTGQKAFQLEQLILLGGKRKSEIEIAKSNAKIAELEFQQLLRQLKFRLHSDLFAIGQQQVLLQRYNNQLDLLNTLLSAYETQATKGNVPLKDVVRLKGAYLKLNNERAALLKEYFETQSSLQTLLQTSAAIQFQFTETDIEKYVQLKSMEEIKAEAMQSRPELQIGLTNKILAGQYLEFQKRLAVPDISLFTAYDQRSGAFNNQVNAGFSIPLPLWNRNQGNIRASQFRIREADYGLQAIQAEMMSDIQNAYALYMQTVSEYQKAIALYNEDFEITVKGMTDNFQKRNVSIVEFIDFFEAYNETLNELTRIKTQLVISAEQLNLLTGKDIY
ncbi:MAG: TolC family protein [Chitinophagaceae bacterium]|nr:TolC family protein [Chitinophagaceae bacterium]MCW5927554.1 TolC family protein [Chitinophagaceae bacterium]